LGDEDQLAQFKELARRARSTFSTFLAAEGIEPFHVAYAPHVAWVADVYHMGADNDVPLLRVHGLLLWEQSAVRGPVALYQLPDDEQNRARLQKMRDRFGEPTAVHCHQRLEQDVFTASAIMIDVVVRSADENPTLQKGLKAVVNTSHPLELGSAGGLSPRGAGFSPAGAVSGGQSATTSVPRPSWVHSSELIGPCSTEDFANLMGISTKHLYTQIRGEKVWREQGPTKKRFYFYLRDQKKHQKLRTDFERNRKNQ
jgi:hypothetical protein